MQVECLLTGTVDQSCVGLLDIFYPRIGKSLVGFLLLRALTAAGLFWPRLIMRLKPHLVPQPLRTLRLPCASHDMGNEGCRIQTRTFAWCILTTPHQLHRSLPNHVAVCVDYITRKEMLKTFYTIHCSQQNGTNRAYVSLLYTTAHGANCWTTIKPDNRRTAQPHQLLLP